VEKRERKVPTTNPFGEAKPRDELEAQKKIEEQKRILSDLEEKDKKVEPQDNDPSIKASSPEGLVHENNEQVGTNGVTSPTDPVPASSAEVKSERTFGRPRDNKDRREPKEGERRERGRGRGGRGGRGRGDRNDDRSDRREGGRGGRGGDRSRGGGEEREGRGRGRGGDSSRFADNRKPRDSKSGGEQQQTRQPKSGRDRQQSSDDHNQPNSSNPPQQTPTQKAKPAVASKGIKTLDLQSSVPAVANQNPFAALSLDMNNNF